MYAAVVAGVISAFTGAYLLFARGGFWRVRVHGSQTATAATANIIAIIPARNEADVIASAVASLLSQPGSESMHIVVVDDASCDATADAARDAAARSGMTRSLTVIQGRPLPSGWTGKLWAMQQGAEYARGLHPQFLLFTDADIVHAPGSISTLVGLAQHGGYDLASFMVKLHCGSFAEKLLIPAFIFFFFKLYPPAWVAEARRSTAAAAGGCMLIRPEALARAGGFEAIRGEIIDDCALAAAVKRSGGNVWLGLTPGISIRRYQSFAAIGRMISRTAFNQLRHSGLLLAAALIGLGFTYLVPVGLVFTGRPLPMAFAVISLAAMAFAYLPMVRFYGLHPLWALSLPAAALFYMGATLHSALKFWSGRGGEWKGRLQDPAA